MGTKVLPGTEIESVESFTLRKYDVTLLARESKSNSSFSEGCLLLGKMEVLNISFCIMNLFQQRIHFYSLFRFLIFLHRIHIVKIDDPINISMNGSRKCLFIFCIYWILDILNNYWHCWLHYPMFSILCQ